MTATTAMATKSSRNTKTKKLTRSAIAAVFAASFAAALLISSPVAHAQDKDADDAAASADGAKKVKSYDFTGDEIDGDLIKPDGDFIDTRKFASHGNLIRIRTDFIREILKSAEDL